MESEDTFTYEDEDHFVEMNGGRPMANVAGILYWTQGQPSTIEKRASLKTSM
jgi:hypothetical protein